MISNYDLNKANKVAIALVSRMRNLRSWKQETRKEYLNVLKADKIRNYNLIDLNGFGRHKEIFEQLPAKISPALKTRKGREIHILDVGIGGHETPPEPWELLALFSSFSPRITVMDCNETNLQLLMRGKKLSFPPDCEPYGLKISKALGVSVERSSFVGNKNASFFNLPPEQKNLFDLREQDVVLWQPGKLDLGRFSLAVMLNVTDLTPSSVPL